MKSNPMNSGSRGRLRQGIALISVLLTMVVVLILAFTFSFVALSERRATASSSVVDSTVQIADAVSERARLEIMAAFDTSDYSTGNFLLKLQEQLETGVVTFPSLDGVTKTSVENLDAGWKIHDVFLDANQKAGWIDVAATARAPRGTQTVIRTIGFGVPPIFELALLSETTNCMYCHLQVNGDVGSLEYFRPGSAVVGTGAGSHVDGNVYAAKAVTSDATNLDGRVKKVNGAGVNGQVEANSASPKLPSDIDRDGDVDWPAIEREAARVNANGSVSVNTSANDGARAIGIPLGGEASSLQTSNLGGFSKTYNGNLILEGTEDNPINLNNSVYVEGDVIIKGWVTGVGTLYSGRNVYIAGDLKTKNPPDKPGEDVCSEVSKGAADASDKCAKLNILAGKDSLNLGARGSIIIGDYTEYNTDGQQMPWSQRQSSDYYRRQFGFGVASSGINESHDKAYDKATGDELSLNANGAYVNVDGEVVGGGCGGQVVCRRAVAGLAQAEAESDAYSYSFRPGAITGTGGFKPWLSDEQYRTLLGKESYDYNTWRWDVPNYSQAASLAEKQALLKADLKLALEGDPSAPTGLLVSEASLEALVNGGTDIYDLNGLKVGEFETAPEPGLKDMRVVIAQSATWETQVNRVDAFLYANQRIAGKTSMQAMSVQGGLIGKNVGVLAPGRRLKFSSYQNEISPESDCNDALNELYYVEGSENCSLTINYDYRMRNGGWGFDILNAEIGKTLSWRLAETKSERVSW